MERKKTSVPVVYQKLLPRKAISAIIDAASPDEVVCLTAPYGFGKTLAVISWLRERDLDAVWVSLDNSHNSVSGFWSGLSAAMLNANAFEILDNHEFKKSPVAFFERSVTEAEKSGCDRVLVMDSFRVIRDPALLRMIRDVVSSLLRNWKIIIMSRTGLPSVFNDLLLKRHICLITANELRFGVDEITEYFCLNGREVSSKAVCEIYNTTEGWPASLNVALIVSRDCPVSYGETARAYVKGFFETEIWEYLEDDVKDFLLKTCILEKLTPEYCRAMTGIGEALPMLWRLYTGGLFVSMLDERNAYRYHRVFRDFLRDKLDSSSIDKRYLCGKIAWRMFESGEYEQAFNHFFLAEDLYGISRLLRLLNPNNMGLERYLEMTERLVPENMPDLREYPLIVARIAMIQYLLGNVAEFKRLNKIFLEWIEPGALQIAPEEYAEYVWEAGWLCYLDPTELVLDNKAHEEWCNYRDYVPHLGTLHLLRAATLRVPSVLRGIRDYCPSLGTIEAFAERNRQTSLIREETSIWEMNMIMAEYAYETEDFEKAESLTRAVMLKAEENKMTDIVFVCVALLAKLMRATHGAGEIEALETHLENMITDTGMTFMLQNFHAFRQRNRLADGKAGFTDEFERENYQNVGKPYFYLFYRHVTYVRALLSVKRYNEASIMLVHLELLCEKYARTMDLIEINILKAVADYRLGREESAGKALEQALVCAGNYGFLRIFSDDAGAIWPVLEPVGRKMRGKYVKSVMLCCKKEMKRRGYMPVEKKAELPELTKTEVRILKCLELGMSYKEIALDNGIQVSTVKSHIHSIYSKLDVNNKTSAIIATQNMGILQQPPTLY